MMLKFERSTESVTSAELRDHYLNPYLIGLGIVLLELLEGKSFVTWMNEVNNISLSSNDIKDKADAALRWLNEAKLRNVGELYRYIVKLCLECSFTPAQPRSQRTFTNEKFRKTVYWAIVWPLQKLYDEVCGVEIS